MSHRPDSGRVGFPTVSADLWELQLDTPGTSVAGVSIAALATAFAIDRFKTAIELAEGGSARAFAVRHNTAALGWALSTGGPRRPAMVFAGDGTVEPFRDDPTLLDAEVAVVDCSFIDPGTRVAARLGGHGHLMDWIELLPELSCDALVLAHLPPETTAAAILERLPDELPGTANIVPWVAGPH